MIPTGDIMMMVRKDFEMALRRNSNQALVLMSVDTVCELVIWTGESGPEPFLLCGVRIPSPEIGNTLLCTGLIPMRHISPGDWDELVMGIANGLNAMRENTIARISGGAN